MQISRLVVPGSARGNVRIFDRASYIEAVMGETLDPNTIVVIDEFPAELDPFPVVAIVTENEFLPHSHMAMLAEKSNIPVAQQPGATKSKVWKELSEGDRYYQALFSDKGILPQREINASKLRVKPKKLEQRPIDRSYRKILGKAELANAEVRQSGQKVIHLARASAELDSDKPGSEATLEKFAGIPFGIFYQYLDDSSWSINPGRSLFAVLGSLNHQLNSYQMAGNQTPTYLALETRKLGQFRELFLTHEMPEPLLEHIYVSLEVEIGDLMQALRFRSSNDLEDELGAGTYDSIRLEAATHGNRERRKKEISLAIRKVWASLYNRRAFLMRKRYQLDEDQVAMSVLVHPSHDNEEFHAVTTFTNSYGVERADFILYPRGGSATSPQSGALHEFISFERSSERTVPLRVTKDGQTYTADHESVPRLAPFTIYDSLFSLMRRTYHQMHYDVSARQRRLTFEWIIHGEKRRPGLLQVKIRNVEAEPLPPSTSDYIPPDIANQLSAVPAEPGFAPLKETGIYEWPEYLRRHLGDGGIRSAAYYLVEYKGKTHLLMGAMHLTGISAIRQSLDGEEFSLLDLGRFDIGTSVNSPGSSLGIDYLVINGSGNGYEDTKIEKWSDAKQNEIFARLIKAFKIEQILDSNSDAILSVSNHLRYSPTARPLRDFDFFGQLSGGL